MDDVLKLEVQRWMCLASDDLDSAKELMKREPPITRNACFLTQQCVEKSFKAYLVSQGQHIEKTHFLLRLHTLCRNIDSEFNKYREHAQNLTDYAVRTRYPNDWRDFPVDEAKEAIVKAEEVIVFVYEKLKAYLI
ncbi:MAG: HEPN domain-containing protein [Candidatus Hatepunaea meridiana]|nr:HEPN domain-containing protein [Candidatus Hatepunaea meridiana]